MMRKIIKKLVYFLLGMLMLAGVFVLICAFNPDITNAVADFLYADRERQIPEEDEPEQALQETSGTDTVSVAIQTGEEAVSPEQGEIKIPNEVLGKNGYTPIREEGRQIAEDEAEELVRALGIGESGDGLTFDPLFYPYYAMLNEKEQHLYRQIYANAVSLNAAFAPVEEVQVSELNRIFAAVYNDHPELFFVETAYYCKYRSSGQCVEIDLVFNRTAEELEAASALFEERVEQIADGAQRFTSNYEREKYVHDMLIEQVAYQAAAEMGQSAYSALVNGQTVCAGYARAFQYILQKLGIPCYYCTGYAGENHAWNIVMLDDGYYHVDVTWDDTPEGTYDYFNKSDEDYADTHIRREMAVYLPPCNGLRYRNPEEESVAPEEVIDNLTDYYADCYQQMTANGTGSYTFVNVLEGEELLQQLLSAYQSEAYRAGYMDSVMEAAKAGQCEMKLSLTELSGGQYRITHEVTMQ